MTKAGFLQREARNGRSGYALSRSWIEWSSGVPGDHAGDDQPENGWTVLTFSVPETRRADRHTLRTVLERNGFAPLNGGVWLSSSVRLASVQLSLERAGLIDYVDIFTAQYAGRADLAEFARRTWDIDRLDAMYRDFISDVKRRLGRAPAPDRRTFADVVLPSNTWRRLDHQDPRLPTQALPARWPRGEAQRFWDELLARTLEPARRYVESLDSLT
jgi:phenylacetic acid degradation operon negative regulatory protein